MKRRVSLLVAVTLLAACDAPTVGPDPRPEAPAGSAVNPVRHDLPPVASAQKDDVPQRMPKGTPRPALEAAAWAILEGRRPEADFPTESYEPTLPSPPLYGAGGYQAHAPQLRMSPVSISTGLPPEVVTRVARMRFPAIRSCYDRILRDDPGKGGDVSVSLTIDKKGDVKVTTPAGDPLLGPCVSKALSTAKMPEPESKAPVTASFRITFVPGGR